VDGVNFGAGVRAIEVELTLRERQVVQGLAVGLVYKQIGAALEMRATSVKNIAGTVRERWGLRTNCEAVAVCLRAGVVQ